MNFPQWYHAMCNNAGHYTYRRKNLLFAAAPEANNKKKQRSVENLTVLAHNRMNDAKNTPIISLRLTALETPLSQMYFEPTLSTHSIYYAGFRER